MKRAALGLSLLVACTPAGSMRPAGGGRAARQDGGLSFLASSLRPWPRAESRDSAVVVTDPQAGRVATYDDALVVLVLLRRGEREDAARLVRGLRALQRADGSLPFSFVLPKPDDAVPYVRTGAIAWAGYAACEFLDSERGGPARDAALALARGAADYVLAHQVDRAGDPRDGLVLGGAGTLRYDVEHGRVRESVVPGELTWAGTEHNVDAFFFLRALARVTGEARYDAAAARIRTGLVRAYRESAGQLARGVTEAGPDDVLSLDCASWGSVLLAAAGEKARAETSAAVADGRYAARDPRTSASGHKAQATGPLVEATVLREHLGAQLPARDWSDVSLVWPEGSAGVAFAALRAGRRDRARALLDALEPLRGPDGALPTATLEVPFVFDTKPSVAGTAWALLVRFELARPEGRPTLWVP